MKILSLVPVFACSAFLWSANSFAAPPQSSYETAIHLSSGKDLICGVNQAQPSGSAVRSPRANKPKPTCWPRNVCVC